MGSRHQHQHQRHYSRRLQGRSGVKDGDEIGLAAGGSIRSVTRDEVRGGHANAWKNPASPSASTRPPACGEEEGATEGPCGRANQAG